MRDREIERDREREKEMVLLPKFCEFCKGRLGGKVPMTLREDTLRISK